MPGSGDPLRSVEGRGQSKVITIVSGLPRSGTSLMMQMLAAGGLPITSDGVRAPDAHNPRGYFEDERVKSLRRESAWVVEARGCALKVVAPLLRFLPDGQQYRVLWMLRDLDEVMASQGQMLDLEGRSAARANEAALREAFTAQLERVRALLEQREIPFLEIEHRRALQSPLPTIEQVARFLEVELDTHAAAAVVDSSLHRQQN